MIDKLVSTMYLIQWWLERRIENATMFVARKLPKRLRLWVVVLSAVKACGETKSPSEIGYKEMHDNA